MKRGYGALWFVLTLIVFLIVWQPRGDRSLQSLFLKGAGEVPFDDDALSAEVQALKARLAALEEAEERLFPGGREEIPAFVYSRYFFNLKNEFIVTAGEEKGVRVGNAVVYPPQGILLGKVKEVFPRHSLVVTIFDPRWESPVRVGDEGVNALLRGSGEPMLTLIEKAARVDTGDIVVNASEEFPYGLPIAEVKEVRLSSDGLFQEATLRFAYDLERLSLVSLLEHAP